MSRETLYENGPIAFDDRLLFPSLLIANIPSLKPSLKPHLHVQKKLETAPPKLGMDCQIFGKAPRACKHNEILGVPRPQAPRGSLGTGKRGTVV